MGYEFICGIPMVFVAALAIVLGLYITLEGLEDWAAGKPFFEIIKIRSRAQQSIPMLV